MHHILEQISKLFASCMYDDARFLCGVALSMGDHNTDAFPLSAKCQVVYIQAESCFELGETVKALGLYHKALHIKKMIAKVKAKPGAALSSEGPAESDIRFKMYKSYCETKQFQEAIAVLEELNSKQRTCQISMALARLYHRCGKDRSAATAYKDVLRECPTSGEAIRALLSLGVKGAEVASLVLSNSTTSSLDLQDWLSTWIKAEAAAAELDYPSSVQLFRSLDSKPFLANNTDVICRIGQLCFLSGDYLQATNILLRVHELDRLNLYKMDLLAFLLHHGKQHKQLENLGTHLMSVSERRAEPWVAVGYTSLAAKKTPRAVYFAQKALNIDPMNVEALMMKGSALLELKKIPEAVTHVREALRLSPNRYEAHKALVDCYLVENRVKEACTLAQQACKQLGTTVRSLTLLAFVLAKDPTTLDKAKSCLEKAIKMDDNNLEPIYLMVEILQQQQQFDKAIELLKQVLRQQNTCRLHQLLGDVLSQTNNQTEAMDHYSQALNLDPVNMEALTGLGRIEHRAEFALGNLSGARAEDIAGSDAEGRLEGSDVESWSDIELA